MFSVERVTHVQCWRIAALGSEGYSEPCQTSKLEPFAKTVNHFQPSTFLEKYFILDIWLHSEYASGIDALNMLKVDKKETVFQLALLPTLKKTVLG